MAPMPRPENRPKRAGGARRPPRASVSPHERHRSLLYARHRAVAVDPLQGAVARGADGGGARAHRAHQPGHQRVLHDDGDGGDGRGPPRRGDRDDGPAPRRSSRHSGVHQGPGPHEGCPDHVRVVHLRASRSRRGCAVRPPAEGCGRHHGGQDDEPGVRLEGPRPEPGHGAHAQSVEYRDDARRLQLGRGGRHRGGARAARQWLGRRRLDSHSRRVLRRLRPQALVWPGAHVAGLERRLRLALGTDDAHRGGRGPDAGGDGRPRRVGPDIARGQARRLRG